MNHSEREPSPLSDPVFGEPIHVYTRRQAIDDGVLIHVGNIPSKPEPITICFTCSLFADYRDPEARRKVIRKGLVLLDQSDPEDDGYRKLRVVEKSRIWVIWDGDGITFLRPEDY